MTDKQPIVVGQVWERTRDGRLVKITRYDMEWDDVRYVSIGGRGLGTGVIYGDNLRSRYRLIGAAS